MGGSMSPGADADVLAALPGVAAQTPGLELLMLFGSRARGDAHHGSDWDFGYLAAGDIDHAALLAAIVETVRSDRVDLVNLAPASGLLRYRAARDGVVVFEARPRLSEAFRLEALDFWCDAGPLLQQGYAAVLAELDR
jgi:predicted nucleotidyltransferase